MSDGELLRRPIGVLYQFLSTRFPGYSCSRFSDNGECRNGKKRRPRVFVTAYCLRGQRSCVGPVPVLELDGKLLRFTGRNFDAPNLQLQLLR